MFLNIILLDRPQWVFLFYEVKGGGGLGCPVNKHQCPSYNPPPPLQNRYRYIIYNENYNWSNGPDFLDDNVFCCI